MIIAFILFTIVLAVVGGGFMFLLHLSQRNRMRLVGANGINNGGNLRDYIPEGRTGMLVLLLGGGLLFLLFAAFQMASPEVGSVATMVTNSWIWLVIALALLYASVHFMEEPYGGALAPLLQLIGVFMVAGWLYAGVASLWQDHEEAVHASEQTAHEQATRLYDQQVHYAEQQQKTCGLSVGSVCKCPGPDYVMRYLHPGETAAVLTDRPVKFIPEPSPKTFTLCHDPNDPDGCVKAGQQNVLGAQVYVVNNSQETIPLTCYYSSY